jgi:hypothetical protein
LERSGSVTGGQLDERGRASQRCNWAAEEVEDGRSQKGHSEQAHCRKAGCDRGGQASGRSPVDFFTDLLKNEEVPLELRFSAAKELAPYVHPKLASVEARTGGKTHEQRLEELLAMEARDNDEP